MSIDQNLANLAKLMHRMASNDMGDLSAAEAACFHTACAAIDNLLIARECRKEDEEEMLRDASNSSDLKYRMWRINQEKESKS
jgi:hypothetical protein